MPNTHCLPSGSLGTSELPTPQISTKNTSIKMPTSTPYRGVVVMLHGLNGNHDYPWPIPFPIADVGGGFPSYQYSFFNWLSGDGWIVIQPPYVGDFYKTPPINGMKADINADAGKGIRFKGTILHWWDHLVEFVNQQFGKKMPIIPFGFSFGGFNILTVVQNRWNVSPQMIAYVAHASATVITYIPSAILGTGLTDSSGCDIGQHALDAVTIPGVICYGTSDAIIGWGVPGQGTCPSSGYTLPFNNVDMIIVNAQAAGRPVSRFQTTDTHSFQSGDVALYTDWFTNVVDPLAPRVL